MRLTEQKIRTFKPRGKTLDVHWDSEVTGFGVRTYLSGRKTFVLRYFDGLRKRIRTIAEISEIKLEDARAEAKRINHRNSRLLSEFSNSPAFSSFSEDYLELHSKPLKKRWKEDQRRIKQYLSPAFGNQSLASIQTIDVVRLHRRISERAPYEANRVLSLLKSMFNKARLWSRYTGPNPTAGVQKNKEVPRSRFITEEEMPRLVEVLQQEKDIYIRKAVLLYLLTGVRRQELLNAKWSDIDWKLKVLTLRDTKNGEPFDVFLSVDALTVLTSFPLRRDNPYIIPGLVPGQPRIDINKAWDRIRKQAELEDVRIHDLRRTFGSWLAISGYSLIVIGEALHHKHPSTTKIYGRLTRTTLRIATEDVGKKFSSIFGDCLLK